MSGRLPDGGHGEPPAALFDRALGHHRAGRLDEAARLYQAVLGLVPGQADALHLLGAIANQRGRYAEAIPLIERALAINANFPFALHNLGLAYHSLGRLTEAETQYRRAIALAPGLADSHNNLGNVLRATGRRDEARAAFATAVELRPAFPDALNNLANVLGEEDDHEAALALLDRAIAAAPGYADAHANRGRTLLALARLGDAEASFRAALALRSDHAVAQCGLGAVHVRRRRDTEAESAFRRALEIDPALAEAHANLGNLAIERGRHGEAVACFERALALQPDNERALLGLGLAKREMRDLDGAIAAARKALEIRPESALALALLVTWKTDAADWTAPETIAALDRAIDAALERGRRAPVAPFFYLQLATDPERHRRIAVSWSATIAAATPASRIARPRPGRAERDRRLRIGYTSADFRAHAVAQTIGNVFRRHDRDRFEIVAYSYGPRDGSPFRDRIATSVDRFVDIASLSDEAAARLIETDGIDILVDLSGFTQATRLEIHAHRPAPVRVTGIGYPGTTGAPFFDYLIADPVLIPPEDERFFTESIVRLPHFYMPSDRTFERDIPATTRAAVGLPEDTVVFASFHQASRVEPVIFEAWMRILREVPEGVLWLLTPGAVAERNLRREIAARGVDPGRLIVAPRRDNKEHHLARLALADIMLDTRVYTGHVTSCDALWMGVPVVTIEGRHFPGRVAASAVRNAGIPELVVGSLDDYCALVIRLAGAPSMRASIGRRLLDGRDAVPLFDSARYIRNLERAFRCMWRRHCDGVPPASIDVDESEPT